jgi:hypothetical protein
MQSEGGRTTRNVCEAFTRKAEQSGGFVMTRGVFPLLSGTFPAPVLAWTQSA